MSELKTRISLLYKSYNEWISYTSTFVPLKGEVCFCDVPAEAHVVASEPCLMFKVGDGTTPFPSLRWASAKAADVYAWAKKANLDFSDLDETFKNNLIEYISGKIETTNTLYRLYSPEEYVWKLQKSDDKGTTWVDAVGEINIKTVVARMAALETAVSGVTDRVVVVENWIKEDGIMSEAEIKEICPANI